MSDSSRPQTPTSATDIVSVVERAVHGDRSLAMVMGAIVDGANMTGRVPLHAITRRYIEEHREGRALAPDEVRSHLAAALLPRLAASGVIEPFASGVAEPDAEVRITPDLWDAVQALSLIHI